MSKTFCLSGQLHEYLCSVGVRDTEILRALREETASLKTAEMQMAPEQGQLMHFLVKLIGAKRILELGVFTGYSSLCMALALPSDGELVACDRSDEWLTIAKKYWQQAGVENKIKLHIAPAIDTLKNLLKAQQQASFDMAFVDADKVHTDFYYEKCLQLVKPGGLIVIDNVLHAGGRLVSDKNDASPGVIAMQELNEKLHADPRVELVMLPVSDGVTLLRVNPNPVAVL